MYRPTVEELQEREERKRYMQDLFKSGMTYEEIGKKLDLSKQRVFQLIGGIIKRRVKPFTTETCVYSGLREWLNEHKIGINELTRKLYGNYHTTSRERVKNRLNGKLQITKTYIDKILEITGLTYEQAFVESQCIRKEDEGK